MRTIMKCNTTQKFCPSNDRGRFDFLEKFTKNTNRIVQIQFFDLRLVV